MVHGDIIFHQFLYLLATGSSSSRRTDEVRWKRRRRRRFFPLPHFTLGRPRLERQYLQKRGHQSERTAFSPTTRVPVIPVWRAAYNMHVSSCREWRVCVCTLSTLLLQTAPIRFPPHINPSVSGTGRLLHKNKLLIGDVIVSDVQASVKE